jgi:hypothetical protein
MSLTYSAESAALASDLNAPECEQSPSAKSSHSAEKSLQSTGPTSSNTQTLERLPQSSLQQMVFASMSSAVDSPAKTLALPEKAQGLRVNAPGYGESTPELLAKYDPSLSLWKTSQLCLEGGLETFSETWPRSGMTRSGIAYRLPTLAHLTVETASGLLPTPVSIDAGSGKFNTSIGGTPRPTLALMARRNLWPTPRGCNAMAATITPQSAWKDGRFPNLETVVGRRMWPTPSANDNRDRGNLSSPAIARRAAKGKQLMLSMVVSETSGQLNPMWVEGLMGFPLGWSDIAEKD